MRYKYTLDTRIRQHIEWQIEHYHEDRRQLKIAKDDMIPSPTASYSLTAGTSSSNVNRSTENIAVRIETNQYIKQLEQSCTAIERVLCRLPAEDKELIEIYYWRHEYTADGVGMKLNMTRRTVYRHINDILTAVALEMGYINL